MFGDISAWLEAAGRYPLLTKAEEVHLGTLVQRGQQPDATPAQKRAAARARDRFIRCNLRLVVSTSKRYVRRLSRVAGMTHEDLLQEGVLGLTRGVEKFDPERGYAASTYLTLWIQQAMGRAITVHGNAIYIPGAVQNWITKLYYAPPEVLRSDEAIKDFLGLSDSNLKTLKLGLLAMQPISMDRGVENYSGDEMLPLSEIIADTRNQPSTDLIDYELGLAAVSATVDPEELEWLQQAAEGTTIRTLAKRIGVKPSAMSHRVNTARRKARMAAGPEVALVLAA